MEHILRQFRETVGTLPQTSPKNLPSNADMQILLQLGMQGLIPQGLDRKVMTQDTKQDYWHPPLRKGF